ncbi:MAG: 3-deoxy-D-manno-octulosonic acid transferase [Ichthyobacteriaceae bacterium]|nr:3-deoxy-D-manno-octulosonic acid transferase [Ichthyobacteriaceae bacterium]
MNTIYNISIYIFGFLLYIVSFFNKKAKLMIEGRSDLISKIKAEIKPNDNPIWFHAASLGEFEQGRPLIEDIKKNYPNQKILLTFYSPSGYEIRKNYNEVDYVFYIPLDTQKNAKDFIEAVNPKMVIFIKYDIWPNIVNQLNKQQINTVLTSAIFRENQVYFKNYGGFMKNVLTNISKIFVQDNKSIELLKSININNAEFSGDTRFDRVKNILSQDNTLNFVENFKGSDKLLIAGSTWPLDEELLTEFINNNNSSKTIIAPHNISENNILKLQQNLKCKTIRYTEIENKDLKEYDILILDTIGILTKVYSYADIAYVGGGFEKGIHNILEPATFSVPVIIGPKFQKFKEAKDLHKLGGVLVVNNINELTSYFKKADDNAIEIGKISYKYIENQSGATNTILKYLYKYL